MMRYLKFLTLLVLPVLACVKRGGEANQPLQGKPESAPPSKPSTTVDELVKRSPLSSPTSSPASLLEKYADGSLLIEMKPHVYLSEMGCTIVIDHQGNSFSQLYLVIAFSIQDRHYYTIWGVIHGKGPPIQLDREKEYSFLVKPYRQPEFNDESVPCRIIKIWDGEKIVYEAQQEE